MRAVLALTLAVGLCGCGSTDFYGDPPPVVPPEAQSSAPATVPAPAPEATAEQAPLAPAPAPAMTTAEAGTTPPPPVQAAAPAVPDPHCTNLAKLRAIDAAYEGEDPDTQRSVYDRSFIECTEWQAKHRPS
jgi:hypothetical protein